MLASVKSILGCSLAALVLLAGAPARADSARNGWIPGFAEKLPDSASAHVAAPARGTRIKPRLAAPKRDAAPEEGRAAPGVAAATPLVPSPPEQIVYEAFAGTSEAAQFADFGFDVTPPDPMVAAGPSSVLELVNAAGRFYAKDGTPLAGRFSLDVFFGVPSGFFFTDPWAVYDAFSKRFFMSGLSINAPSDDDSKVYLAVSKTSTPTGSTSDWNRYVVSDRSGVIGDQPKLGVTSDKVIITTQDYQGLDDTNPGATIFTMQKSDATGGATLRKSTKSLGPGYFGFMPARQTSSGNNGYVISVGNVVEVRTVTGTPATGNVADTFKDYAIGTPLSSPILPRQPATGERLDVDQRPITSVWQNGTLWLGVTTRCTPSGDSAQRACLRFWRIDTAAKVLREDTTYGVNGSDVFVPSLGFSASGDLHVVYGRSSSSLVPSVYVTGRPAGTSGFTSPVLLALGDASYNDGLGSGASRWGDYYAAATDPTTPSDVWVMGQTALSTTNWVTQLGRVSFSRPSVTRLTPALGDPAGGNTITVSGADFEDGASTVSFGGVPGTGVIVTSPESLTVVVPAAVSGSGTVHVTVANTNGASTTVQSDLYSYGGLFHPIAPQRIATVSLSSAADQLVLVGGVPNIPSTAQAALVNVEVSNPSVAGYIRVTPSDQSSQTAVQEFVAGQTISNLVAVKLGADDKIKLHLSAGSAKVFVDAQGYYGDPTESPSNGEGFHAVPTARLTSLTLNSNADQTVLVRGQVGVTGAADAVVANFEIENPTSNGYLRVTPSNATSQTAVQVFKAGRTISNLGTIKIGPDGRIKLHLSAGSAKIYIDVGGYYADTDDEANGLRFRTLPNARLYGPMTLNTTSDLVLNMRGIGGISPSGVTAVVINVEVQNPTRGGYIRVTPSNAPSQTAVQEFVAGQTISNLVVVKLGADGKVRFHLSTGIATIFVDVEGYF